MNKSFSARFINSLLAVSFILATLPVPAEPIILPNFLNFRIFQSPKADSGVNYDSNGKLMNSETFDLEKDASGNTKVCRTFKEYDQNGYVEKKSEFETVNGPSAHYVIERTFNKDGSVEEHVQGMLKDPSTKANKWINIDETRKITSKAIDGGFIVTTETTDNLTGLKSTEKNKYTGCRYVGDQLVEYNLTRTVDGQRIQNGGIEEIHIVETTKQYDAQVNKQGQLVSFKQDSWSNAAPDKKSTSHYTNHSFDDQNRATSQTVETWEKGRGVDGAGNTIPLDSYSVTERTGMTYNSKGQMVDCKETTYTQEKNQTLERYATEQDPNYFCSSSYGGPPTTADGKVDTTGYEEGYKEKYANSHITTTKGGMTITGKEGYHWKTENTSKTGMSYDHAGRLSYYINSDSRPNSKVYDINGLVDREMVFNGKDKSRNMNFTYDQAGRETHHESITYTDDGMKLREHHWKEYNSLGQVIATVDTYRGSKPRVEVCEGYRYTFTYDEMGNQKQLDRKELFNDTHTRWTTLQVIKIVVLIVIAVVATIAQQHYASAPLWGAVAAAFASYSLDKADGESTETATKGAAIAAITTYFGAQISAGAGANAAGSGQAVGQGLAGAEISVAGGAATIPLAAINGGMTTLTGSFMMNAAIYVGQMALMNFAVNLLQGMDGDKALKSAFASAFVSLVSMCVAANMPESGAITNTGGSATLNWGAFIKELGKGFASGTLKGTLNAYAQAWANDESMSLDDALEIGAAEGLADMAINCMGTALVMSGNELAMEVGHSIVGKGPQNPNSQNLSHDDLVAQNVSYNIQSMAIGQIKSMVFDKLKDHMGEKEAEFLAAVFAGFANASVERIKGRAMDEQSAVEAGEKLADARAGEYVDINGVRYVKGEDGGLLAVNSKGNLVSVDAVFDERSSTYVSGMKDSFIKESLRATLTAFAEKVTKEGTFGREFSLAFAEAAERNFSYYEFLKAKSAIDTMLAKPGNKDANVYLYWDKNGNVKCGVTVAVDSQTGDVKITTYKNEDGRIVEDENLSIQSMFVGSLALNVLKNLPEGAENLKPLTGENVFGMTYELDGKTYVIDLSTGVIFELPEGRNIWVEDGRMQGSYEAHKDGANYYDGDGHKVKFENSRTVMLYGKDETKPPIFIDKELKSFGMVLNGQNIYMGQVNFDPATGKVYLTDMFGANMQFLPAQLADGSLISDGLSARNGIDIFNLPRMMFTEQQAMAVAESIYESALNDGFNPFTKTNSEALTSFLLNNPEALNYLAAKYEDFRKAVNNYGVANDVSNYKSIYDVDDTVSDQRFINSNLLFAFLPVAQTADYEFIKQALISGDLTQLKNVDVMTLAECAQQFCNELSNDYTVSPDVRNRAASYNYLFSSAKYKYEALLDSDYIDAQKQLNYSSVNNIYDFRESQISDQIQALSAVSDKYFLNKFNDQYAPVLSSEALKALDNEDKRIAYAFVREFGGSESVAGNFYENELISNLENQRLIKPLVEAFGSEYISGMFKMNNSVYYKDIMPLEGLSDQEKINILLNQTKLEMAKLVYDYQDYMEKSGVDVSSQVADVAKRLAIYGTDNYLENLAKGALDSQLFNGVIKAGLFDTLYSCVDLDANMTKIAMNDFITRDSDLTTKLAGFELFRSILVEGIIGTPMSLASFGLATPATKKFADEFLTFVSDSYFSGEINRVFNEKAADYQHGIDRLNIAQYNLQQEQERVIIEEYKNRYPEYKSTEDVFRSYLFNDVLEQRRDDIVKTHGYSEQFNTVMTEVWTEVDMRYNEYWSQEKTYTSDTDYGQDYVYLTEMEDSLNNSEVQNANN